MGEVIPESSASSQAVRRRVIVTGGAGFIGREVVAELLRAGHQAVAVVRPTTEAVRAEELRRGGAEVVACGLENAEGLACAMRQSDAVVHLAVSSATDDARAVSETLGATECVIAAMHGAGVRRLVVASSFAVYSYESLQTGSLVTDTSPVVEAERGRDWYCKAKISQESLVQSATEAGRIDAVVLRLGAVYGPGRLWTGRLGVRFGRLWFCIGDNAQIPTLWVRSAAECLVRAALHQAVPASPLNVLDESPPTQREYRRAIAARSRPKPIVVVVPWSLASWLGEAAWAVLSAIPVVKRRLPSFLRPASQAARFKPFRFANIGCSEALGWRSRVPLAEALDQSCGSRVQLRAGVLPAAGARA